MELRPRIGSIYLMTCNKTGKHYVGQTIQPVIRRIYHHFFNAFDNNPNSRGCPKLDNAIKKYGKESFSWVVLETIESTSIEFLYTELDKLEEKYIKKYNSFADGYNCTSGGQKERTYYSPEVIEKFKLASLGKKQSKETIMKRMKTFSETGVLDKFRKPVIQMDMDGNFIKEWPSIMSAAIELGGSKNSHICDVCNGKRSHWHNYRWKYKL